MSKYEKCAPLELLKEITEDYPGVWDIMKHFHDRNGKDGLPSWPDWCYAPIAAGLAVTFPTGVEDCSYQEIIHGSADAAIIAALAPWRLNKEVFVFDSELAEVLYSQGLDLDVPAEFLLKLPYQVFYIQTAGLKYRGVDMDGFIMHLEYDVNDNSRELRLLFIPKDLNNNTPFGFPIHIDESSLLESLERTMEEGFNVAKRQRDPAMLSFLKHAAKESKEDLLKITSQSLQLVLYIVASNSEIAPDPEQKTVTKKGKTVRDKYREIRKWDVGYRVGYALRKHRLSQRAESTASRSNIKESKEQVSRSSPRPHLRKAHWHKFWTGPRDGEKELKIKWLPPMAINFSKEDEEDDRPIIYHPIIQ